MIHANLADVSPGPRDVCYSKGMTDNEITPVYTHTTAQVMAAIAQTMVNAANAINDADSIAEAKAILTARAQGAYALVNAAGSAL